MSEPTHRLPAWVWHVERLYGEKVPQCVRCGSHDLRENLARCSYHCGGCGWELSDRVGVRFVPKDQNVRLPDEFPDVLPARERTR